jgi:hypothetical protein
MEHLFSSVVEVQHLDLTVINGEAVTGWVTKTDEDASYLRCRLDLNFLRPGKDIPAPINAGVVPDRIGIMFCSPWAPIKAGDRIVCIPNEMGEMPVEGTFEIRAIPDRALDYASAHHIEVQILETTNSPENETGLREFPDSGGDDLG